MKYIREFKNYLNNNFYQWFGNSKVVDDKDKPEIVYHGSYDNITRFIPDFGGSHTVNNQNGSFYFTNNEGVAEDYAKQSYLTNKRDNDDEREDDEILAQAEDKSHIIDVYLKIETPLELISNDGYVDPDKTDKYIEYIKSGIMTDPYSDYNADEETIEFFDKYKIYDKDEIQDSMDDIRQCFFDNDIIDDIDEEFDEEFLMYNLKTYSVDYGGCEPTYPEFDGVIWRNVYDMITTNSSMVMNVYIVFDPTQIKSASKNVGKFSSYNAIITEKTQNI